MTSTKCRYAVAMTALLLASCAGRRPAYIAVPRAASRSEEPVTLPLDPAGRGRLEAFLSRAGHPNAADPVPDPRAAEHARALDALGRSDALAVGAANPAARRFCDMVEKLCAAAPLFRGKPLVRQIVDARESRRPVPAPLAVADGGYWWIFRVQGGRLAAVLLVCDVRREVER
jgi:hypothetical protein